MSMTAGDVREANLRIRLLAAVDGDPRKAQAAWEIIGPELGDWRAAAQGWEERAERVTAERDDAVDLLRLLAYRDECRQFDHHGWCQTHGWLRDGGCPHARAQELLAALEIRRLAQATTEETNDEHS